MFNGRTIQDEVARYQEHYNMLFGYNKKPNVFKVENKNKNNIKNPQPSTSRNTAYDYYEPINESKIRKIDENLISTINKALDLIKNWEVIEETKNEGNQNNMMYEEDIHTLFNDEINNNIIYDEKIINNEIIYDEINEMNICYAQSNENNIIDNMIIYDDEIINNNNNNMYVNETKYDDDCKIIKSFKNNVHNEVNKKIKCKGVNTNDIKKINKNKNIRSSDESDQVSDNTDIDVVNQRKIKIKEIIKVFKQKEINNSVSVKINELRGYSIFSNKKLKSNILEIENKIILGIKNKIIEGIKNIIAKFDEGKRPSRGRLKINEKYYNSCKNRVESIWVCNTRKRGK